ncbi:hypothetical protein ABZ738_07170 [Micromonospora sp. NPDC047793]
MAVAKVDRSVRFTKRNSMIGEALGETGEGEAGRRGGGAAE